MQKWEYYVATVGWSASRKEYGISAGQGLELSQGLKHLGEQGFELVGIQTSQDSGVFGGAPAGYTYIFKRPLENA